jgi:cyclopropane fatty-acyl-phospholipid synthase-like methyltransferase
MDLYEPTKHALEHLYPLVQKGGFIIIDGYGYWEGCRKAVDEFFERNNINIHDLIYIDYTCRVFKKRDSSSTLKGFLGGGWDDETHLKLYANNFNRGMANYLVTKIAPKSFLEFGSGLGFLAKHIDEHIDLESSFCIEPNYIKGLYGEMTNVKFLQLNIFKDDIPREIDQKFDLVVSIEVAEHIERNKHHILFDFLVNKTNNWLVFSGARIGQGGHGHISERAENDWKGEFLSRGMIFDEQRTKDIRNACDKKNINHRKNVMVFYKPSATSS